MIRKHNRDILPAILFVLVPSMLPMAWAVVLAADSADVPILTYKVIKTYPHDPRAFTQGLVMDDGVLFEGTGRRGHSSLRRVDLETGTVEQRFTLPDRFFGEGITVFGDRIIQLSWQAGYGFIYDKKTFELQRVFSFPGEGWGLTHDGKFLIVSDGTATLRFLDPETFAEVRRLEIVDSSGPVIRLNELEYIEGKLYANIWQTDRIVIIDPATGRVTAWLDLAGLLEAKGVAKPVDVLNGIAYDVQNKRLYVTGKLWPVLFQVEVVKKNK